MREKIEPGGGDKPDVEIVDPNDPEEKSKENKMDRTPTTVRMKVQDSGRNKMWMPEGDKMSVQNLDSIINEILEKAKYWGGGFSMTAGPGGKMVTTKKPVTWGTDEKASEKEARLAAVAAHNKRIKQKIAQAIANKRKVIQFPQRGQTMAGGEKQRKLLKAGLELKRELEDFVSEYRSKHRTTAREREAKQAAKNASLERTRERQRELRKQRVIASIGT